MAIWYRAAQIENIQTVFSGMGGLYAAGRWNHLGRKIVYCSQSISLCTLEWLSHNGLSVSGFSYYRYAIDVPDDLIKCFPELELPDEWNKTPAVDITRNFAEEHLFASSQLAIAVPSVMVPEECNLLINPLHQSFAEVIQTVKTLGKYTAPIRDL